MGSFLTKHGDGRPIASEFLEECRNATDKELLIAVEVNSGQPAKRGVFKAELRRRQLCRQNKILAEQVKLSRLAGKAAWCSAIAAILAAVAALGSFVVALMK